MPIHYRILIIIFITFFALFPSGAFADTSAASSAKLKKNRLFLSTHGEFGYARDLGKGLQVGIRMDHRKYEFRRRADLPGKDIYGYSYGDDNNELPYVKYRARIGPLFYGIYTAFLWDFSEVGGEIGGKFSYDYKLAKGIILNLWAKPFQLQIWQDRNSQLILDSFPGIDLNVTF